MRKIALIDDSEEYSSIFTVRLDLELNDASVVVERFGSLEEITGLNCEEYEMLIADFHLFDSFNYDSDEQISDDLNGSSLLKMYKKECPDLKVVLISGDTDVTDTQDKVGFFKSIFGKKSEINYKYNKTDPMLFEHLKAILEQ